MDLNTSESLEKKKKKIKPLKIEWLSFWKSPNALFPINNPCFLFPRENVRNAHNFQITPIKLPTETTGTQLSHALVHIFLALSVS